MRTGKYNLRVSTPIKRIGQCTGCTAGCVALLALLLYPIFSSTKKYHGPSCLSNEKQIAIGFLMYAQDYDDHLPRASRWMDTLNPYTKNEAILHCPKAEEVNPQNYGYAFNSDLASHSVEKQQTPETTALLYDSTWLWRSAHAPGLTGLASPPRHQDGNNIAYVDGHAKFRKLENAKERQGSSQ